MKNGSNNRPLESTEMGKYLTCELTYQWYQDLTTDGWGGVWEPKVFFELFYNLYAVIIAHRENPLLALQKLNERLENYTPSEKYYVYACLEAKIENDLDTIFVLPNDKLRICLSLITTEINKHWPERNTSNIEENTFNWRSVKQHLETLTDAKSKIAYLISISTDYKQHLIISKDTATRFDELCTLEIEKIKQHEELQAMRAPYEGNVFLINSKGVRINVIRIINALYEMKYFRDVEEQIPTKESVMVAIGKSLGIDLSTYDSDLSQAFNTGNPEKNIAIFQQMIDITTKQVTTRNENPTLK